MRPVIALPILGSIVTSASAAATDIRELLDAQTGHTVISEQQSTRRTNEQPWRCPLPSLVTGGRYGTN